MDKEARIFFINILMVKEKAKNKGIKNEISWGAFASVKLSG